MTRIDNARVIRAARGTDAHAKSWLTEAPLRMLMNNLDPEVAEKPEELVVYGGIGRAARDWESFDRIVATLQRLEDDETLLVQSGKPVGVFRTHADAPRVLIANSNLVPHWATWEHFHELDRKGLMMYGQMTAGSWIYIGTQGIVQGTYETFVEVGRQHYGGDLAGPLDPHRRPRRHGRRAAAGGDHGRRLVPRGRVPAEPHRDAAATGYLDKRDRRSRRGAGDDRRGARPREAGLGRPARQRRRHLPGTGARAACGRTSVTDQTSAHDPINGYLPQGWTLAEWERARERDPEAVEAAARASMAGMSRAMLDFHGMGVPTLDYGNNIRQMAKEEGVADAFDFPGLRAGLYPPAVLPRHRPVPLGGAVGRSRGHLQDRRQGEGAAAGQRAPAQLARHGARAHPLPGPAGAHLLGRAGRPPPARPRLQRDGGERAN